MPVHLFTQLRISPTSETYMSELTSLTFRTRSIIDFRSSTFALLISLLNLKKLARAFSSHTTTLSARPFSFQ